MKHFGIIAAAVILCSCNSKTGNDIQNVPLQSHLINKEGKTIATRFNTPAGYERIQTTGFGQYLRELPLQPHGSEVHLYNGELKNKKGVYEAVVKMDIGNKDLQQCADAVMRLRAEYLWHSGQADKIHFNFTNGFNAEYGKWQRGNRINVNGNKVQWAQRGSAGNDYSSFRQYMEVVFSYAGTLSLSKELQPVDMKDMQPGDVLIYGGSPGHAVIVVDMAKNRMGRKLYMLAQSYMPAQEIQVLQNPQNNEISPWYELNNEHLIQTPEWTFYPNQLKRFKD
jgi:hypothetical protein